MDAALNTIRLGDCIGKMGELPVAFADFVFADPPFNIGYDYDVYQDNVGHQQYVNWSSEWIEAVYRVLKDNGTFWLAIGDEYAAELKLASQEIGFHCRSWVIWYYTFGVNCSKKFSRSHAHLFHFVKDPKDFTFCEGLPDAEGNFDFIRVPSARQLVYNDRRANPKGRLPDDTWINRPADAVGELADDNGSWVASDVLPPSDEDRTWALRPQDLEQCFQSDEDTWYFPRVAGTFKERAGFHGCQMPEQLLGRIVRMCSNNGDMVLDPFSGSATTLAVAKKLGRKYLGFDISEDYVKFGLDRLSSVRVGDRLDGSPEPLVSAPKTAEDRRRTLKKSQLTTSNHAQSKEERYSQIQLELTLRGLIEAFRLTHEGFSADRVVADPEMNLRFTDACNSMELAGDRRTWNILLFRLRKSGKLSHIKTTQRTTCSWIDCDEYLFASEIALQEMLNSELAASLDEILCDPLLAAQFDEKAERFAGKLTSLQFRWAALKLRKQAMLARSRGKVLALPSRLGKRISVDKLNTRKIPEKPGVYLLSGLQKLYVGEALNLRNRLARQFRPKQRRHWISQFREPLYLQTFSTETSPAEMLAWQSCFVKKHKPRWNLQELLTVS